MTNLSSDEKTILLQLVRETIEAKLKNRRLDLSNIKLTPNLKKERATFVTLTINGQLRGCIGNLVPGQALYLNVIENARNAAFGDPRFLPLCLAELLKTRIEISILDSPKKFAYSSSTELVNYLAANHSGVVLSRGPYRATFLPQVWDELPEPEQFLAHLCIKANLSSDDWRHGVMIETYQAEKIQE